MSTQPKSNSLQSYQVVFYGRALHPDLFPLKARKVVRHPAYELEVWVMPGQHVLRFESGSICVSELLTDQERNLPATGILAAFLCGGERDFEHTLPKGRAVYMTSVQTETLSENIYRATYEEVAEIGRQASAVAHAWRDDAGRCQSVIDIQRYTSEIHAQSYHLIANQGLVVRTQTIFELRAAVAAGAKPGSSGHSNGGGGGLPRAGGADGLTDVIRG